MKKASAKKTNDDLRPESDLSQLTGGVRGKYYREATAGTNLVLIDPELANLFLIPNPSTARSACSLNQRRTVKRYGSTGSKKRIKRSA